MQKTSLLQSFGGCFFLEFKRGFGVFLCRFFLETSLLSTKRAAETRNQVGILKASKKKDTSHYLKWIHLRKLTAGTGK